MEKIIELQLKELYSQRADLVRQITNLDANEVSFSPANMEIRTSIDTIDREINGAVQRLENLNLK